MKNRLLNIIILVCAAQVAFAGIGRRIVVAQDGKGNFTSIQQAINSIDTARREPVVVYIRNGVYNEKIFLEKNDVTLQGESEEGVVITQSIARDEWRCTHKDDWGVATLNINANDITLLNLTIRNNFGFEWTHEIKIECPLDSSNAEKILRKDGHQMALRTMGGTRMKAINVHFLAFGGDTVSPWNVEAGMFYFRNCIMEGGVDFYCPRGWAYAVDCKFIAHTGPAAIWHDGSKDKDSKTVLKNCSFEGYDGFKLGRYHRDAQFILLNCVFADNMADEDIYMVKTNNTIQWGRRVFYFNCHRKSGKDFSWHHDNINQLASGSDPTRIDANWVFGDRWQPETVR